MKKLRFLMVCLLALMTGIYFVSCSSDDDDENTNGLIGTWVQEETWSSGGKTYTESYYVTFYSDATCFFYTKDEDGEYEVMKYTYKYDEEAAEIEIYDDYYSDTHTAEVLALTKTNLTLRIHWRFDTETYKATKTSAPLSKSKLEKLNEEQNDDSSY